MNTLSLFSGIGGLDLGFERAGFTIVAQCEKDDYCRRVLAKHWPGVPCHKDVKDVGRDTVPGGVECVIGGFPCQDLSVAGKGAGIHGERSGLWWEMRRVIDEVRPRWVCVENVPALRSRGGDEVLASLEELGYSCWPLVVGAVHAGAPHERKRVFLVAHRGSDDRQQGWEGVRLRGVPAAQGETRGEGGQRAVPPERGGGWGGADDVAHAELARLEGHGADAGLAEVAESWNGGARMGDAARVGREGEGLLDRIVAADPGARRWPARPGEPQHDWEQPRLVADSDGGSRHGLGVERHTGDQRGDGHPGAGVELQGTPELPLGGDADGVPGRLVRAANRDALRAYGNAVVPQVAEMIARAILEAEALA